MSDFKDMVEADMGDVFLSMDEFAEEHDLNGTVCVCIVESPETQEKFQRGEKYEGYEAVSGLAATVHVKKSDIEEMPAEGQKFTLDGEIFMVSDCTEHMGMLTIRLGANISGISGMGAWDR